MNVRAADATQKGQIVKITREIPLWGILSVVGVLAGQAISTYYGQQRLAENVEKLGVEVRALTAEVNKLNLTQVGMQVQISDLQRRMQIVEQQVAARR